MSDPQVEEVCPSRKPLVLDTMKKKVIRFEVHLKNCKLNKQIFYFVGNNGLISLIRDTSN